FVKVRHSIERGSAPDRRSRKMRWTSTWVLPVPAFARTQAETAGSAARRCLCSAACSKAVCDWETSLIWKFRIVDPASPFADAGEVRVRIVFCLIAEDRARFILISDRLIIVACDAGKRAPIGSLDSFRGRHFQRDDLAWRLAARRRDIKQLCRETRW